MKNSAYKKTILILISIINYSLLINNCCVSQPLARQWVSRYNGPGDGYDYMSAMVIDNSGNMYVCGTSDGSGTGTDIVTIKYNSAGVQQWAARYNGTGNSSDEASGGI